jgi:hypothetical protein
MSNSDAVQHKNAYINENSICSKKIVIDIPQFHEDGVITTFYETNTENIEMRTPIIDPRPPPVYMLSTYDQKENHDLDEYNASSYLPTSVPSTSCENVKKINVDMHTTNTKKSRIKKGLALTNYDAIDQDHNLSTKRDEKKERVVVHGWMFSDSQLTKEYQLYLIEKLYNIEYNSVVSVTTTSNHVKDKEIVFVSSQINCKKNGYKQQDIEKGIYCETMFAGFNYIVELLYNSKLLCYYCNDFVHILYKYVREPKQWSLERIFNDRGHNRGNVKIACLTCNLRRKTMHYQKYIDTKKMVSIIKIDGSCINTAHP